MVEVAEVAGAVQRLEDVVVIVGEGEVGNSHRLLPFAIFCISLHT